jgi:small subunit ribosomal protein S7
MPHVNEEAVAYDNILKGEKSPTEKEEGKPVSEVLNESPEARKHAPQVVKDAASAESKTSIKEDVPSASTNLDKFAPKNDDVLQHLVGLIMRHGKKSQAQTRIQDTLSLLGRRSASAGQDPLLLLKDAIERVSPLMKLIQRKQGSKNIPVPIPLTEKGSRRRAVTWILDSASKRPSKSFSERFAQELGAVLDGTSSAFSKQLAVHKVALANRANAAIKS